MSELQLFKFEGREVRTVVDEKGEPWFVAKDVCEGLGVDNPSQAMTRLEEDEKSTLILNEGGIPVNIVNEPGLYSLIMGSRKPEAKKFKKWVTSEVLPSIRKTGKYDTTPVFNVPKTLSEALKLAYEQSLVIETQTLYIEKAKPKVEQFDLFISGENCKDMNQIAKALGTGRTRLFQCLRTRGILTAGNIPYQSFIERGYFKVVETPIPHMNKNYSKTLVTAKGESWICRILNGGTEITQ